MSFAPCPPVAGPAVTDHDRRDDVADDRDGDGRLTSVDRCPDDAEDLDSFDDADGCPDLDDDRDGIADATDSCPTMVETYNGRDDTDGCPDNLVVVRPPPLPTPQRAYFAPRSARLRRSEQPVLGLVVAVREQHPEIERIGLVARVTAGERARVATRRAIAVRDALVALGIEPARLELLALDAQASLGDEGLDRAVELALRRVDGRDVDDPALDGARAVR